MTQSPSSGKKPTFTPKSKRLLPKSPQKTSPKVWPKIAPPKVPQKTPGQLAKELPFADTVGESPWHSGGEKARESVRKLRRQGRKSIAAEATKAAEETLSKATKQALKKVAPAPGSKVFGTPTKHKLDGEEKKSCKQTRIRRQKGAEVDLQKRALSFTSQLIIMLALAHDWKSV